MVSFGVLGGLRCDERNRTKQTREGDQYSRSPRHPQLSPNNKPLYTRPSLLLQRVESEFAPAPCPSSALARGVRGVPRLYQLLATFFRFSMDSLKSKHPSGGAPQQFSGFCRFGEAFVLNRPLKTAWYSSHASAAGSVLVLAWKRR